MPPKKAAKEAPSSSQIFIVIDGASIDSVYASIAFANERARAAKKEGKTEVKVETQEIQGGSVAVDEKKPVAKARALSKTKATKTEVVEFENDLSDAPIEPKKKPEPKAKAAAKAKAPKVESSEDEESDKPAEDKKPATKAKTKAPAKSKAKAAENKEVEAPKTSTAEKKTKSVGEQRAANAKKPVKPEDSNLPDNIKALLAGSGSVFVNKTMVVTGVPPTLGRKNAETLVTAYGGKIVKALSKKTDYVVVGNEAGPKKLEQISGFGIKVLDEDALIAMLEGGSSSGTKRGAPEEEEEEEDEDEGEDDEDDDEPKPTKAKKQKK
ncbi:hypothetical protein BJ875DRAFT_466075 [Amylocarpus encephaloides]|uniref:BRCT domain-containing protein n=1 Tax=Amylocarpus encephaloides TaxID=45428 RepID=A0A9P7YFH7_9HELO|nr:hypothetical protein BJ875DRAFT_466075 [Amylocarpus encephaloides]